jgi:23S rRNA (cytidine2498-2'-O)-methyltransferase
MPHDAPSPACNADGVRRRTAYLAAEGRIDELAFELGEIESRHGRLLIVAGPPRPAAWAANVWLDPQEIAISSISDGAARLRAIQRNWARDAPRLHRRTALIEEALPKVSAKPLVFGAAPPTAALGSWTLLDAETMLAASRCTSPFRNGEILFVEDHTGPPSRAYLKLWEALTVIGRRPGPGEVCLDLGSSPGGWSWALQRMGAHVISRQSAAGARNRQNAQAREPARERLCLKPQQYREGRLAVFGCGVLSGAAPCADRALACGRDVSQFCLHDQIPGPD